MPWAEAYGKGRVCCHEDGLRTGTENLRKMTRVASARPFGVHRFVPRELARASTEIRQGATGMRDPAHQQCSRGVGRTGSCQCPGNLV